jgi:hypothetical protein
MKRHLETPQQPNKAPVVESQKEVNSSSKDQTGMNTTVDNVENIEMEISNVDNPIITSQLETIRGQRPPTINKKWREQFSRVEEFSLEYRTRVENINNDLMIVISNEILAPGLDTTDPDIDLLESLSLQFSDIRELVPWKDLTVKYLESELRVALCCVWRRLNIKKQSRIFIDPNINLTELSKLYERLRFLVRHRDFYKTQRRNSVKGKEEDIKSDSDLLTLDDAITTEEKDKELFKSSTFLLLTGKNPEASVFLGELENIIDKYTSGIRNIDFPIKVLSATRYIISFFKVPPATELKKLENYES